MPDINYADQVLTVHPLEKYKNHLEFLGYSIEEDSEISIFGKHQRKSNLRLIKFGGEIGILARVTYVFPSRFDSDPMPLYIYSNELNREFAFLKAWVGNFEDGGFFLCLDSVLEGEYDRKNFSIFLDNIEHDLNIFHGYIKTKDVFSQQEDLGGDEIPF